MKHHLLWRVFVCICTLLMFCACGKDPAMTTTEHAASATPSDEGPQSVETPEDAAVAYLRRLADVMFLYADTDLRLGSVAELDSDVRLAIPLGSVAFVPQDVLAHLHIGEAPNGTTGPIQIEDGMDFVLEKADYYKLSRMRQKIYREDFKTEYEILRVEMSGDFAQVSVYELISFRYLDSATDSFCGQATDVVLYHLDGRWLVLDVTTEDPLDIEKWNGFDTANTTENWGGSQFR